MTEPSPAGPLRRCVGCGRRAPQRELVRFTIERGELVPGSGRPGRGAYTCPDTACFERARAQRGFARTLRAQVRVDPALVRLYTGAADGERR